MMEHWGSGALGYWSTGMLVHWDSGAHCRCNRKFECGNLVEFDLSADCVHECIAPEAPFSYLFFCPAGYRLRPVSV